ncbi:MAG TPA: MarR family transcriptional regulator [Chitinophagaceae bacterium]|jgi:DNA-binding MarR family transcriptional regulator|nr:MarR family transcriptional regulator [Chitinophagaceae bacterium]
MPDDTILSVRKAGQQYAYTALHLHETIARLAGFSGTDHKYLGFFLQRGSLTAGEFATLTGLTTGAVTGLIDRFEKKKLLKRQLDKQDRRKVIIVPDTKKIRALFEPYYKDFQKATDALISAFPEQERTVIQSFLLQSIELMKATTARLNS